MKAIKTEMSWQDLIEMPIGAVFYEKELPSMPIFIKTGNCHWKYSGKDIQVMALQDDESSRLGLFEMEADELRSRKWHRITDDDINRITGKLCDAWMLNPI